MRETHAKLKSLTPCNECACAGRGKGDVGPVVQIAASRFFSVLLGKDGNVWSFGGGYNGELGPEHAWATRPQPIGPLQEASQQLTI